MMSYEQTTTPLLLFKEQPTQALFKYTLVHPSQGNGSLKSRRPSWPSMATLSMKSERHLRFISCTASSGDALCLFQDCDEIPTDMLMQMMGDRMMQSILTNTAPESEIEKGVRFEGPRNVIKSIKDLFVVLQQS